MSKGHFYFIGGLSVIYAFLLYVSINGWGYMGYNGYHEGPSFWYFNSNVGYYPEPSLRDRSLGGPGRAGGGPRAGK
jgi:hypothetical protein